MGDTADMTLGMKALERGFLTSAELRDALVEHARARDAGSVRSFALFLLCGGYLTAEELASLEAARSSDPSPERRAPAPPPLPVLPDSGPERFGKFELRRLLGRGSMGVVVEAFDTALGRRVALKRPFGQFGGKAPNRLDEERFFAEAGLSALIPRHPGIVQVYEAGRIQGQCYLAMELIEGRSLSDWKKSATFAQELSVLIETARAVHHAHEHSVIHRDLKPANIMIRPSGRAVVTDFGVAKCATPGQSISLTPAGFTIGTPGYMSPEQAQGRKHVDRTTDIYSLGVMLYEALTGRKPFEGRSAMDVLLRMMVEPVRRPSTNLRAGLNPGLLLALDSVCLRALAREPWNRFPTAAAFAGALEEVQGAGAVPWARTA